MQLSRWWGVVLWVGCGGGGGGNPDARRPADAGPDASPRGAVTVTVLDAARTGAPAVGIPVVFLDPDGTLVGRVSTGLDGKASADVLPGASATSVATIGTDAFQMMTVLAIEPGDDITLGHGASPVFVPQAGTFTVSFPTTPTAVEYYAISGCGSSPMSATTSVIVSFYGFCAADPTDLFVLAININGTVFQYLHQPAVTFVDGGTTTMPNAWQNMAQFNASFSNIPASVTEVAMQRYAPNIYGYNQVTGAVVSGASLGLNVSGPIGSTSGVQSTFNGTGGAMQFLTQALPGNTLTYGVDVGATLMPWLGLVTIDPATATLQVPVTGTGDGDVFGYNVSYVRGTTAFLWEIYGPTPGDLVLPTLPPEVGDVGPHPGDANFGGQAYIADSDADAGYAAARLHPAIAVDTAFGANPVAATVRSSVSQPPP